MANDYNIANLLNVAFGVNPGIVFDIPGKPSVNQLAQYAGLNDYKPVMKESASEETKQSWLGTPILFPWYLKGGDQFRMLDDSGEISKQRLGDFYMPAATLVDISREKIQSKSQPLGGNGSVKEMFAFDDWKLRIRGICVADMVFADGSVRTAQQQREGLAKFERVVDAIGVEGYVFAELGIYAITINSIVFRQMEGRPNVIPFEIEAESDTPLELSI